MKGEGKRRKLFYRGVPARVGPDAPADTASGLDSEGDSAKPTPAILLGAFLLAQDDAFW